eukprot:GHUV01053303.1.p1 GENE.GHUV01053303.1~~GHUV01053303.1.p1  ORF type:complete len:158 (+),score=30.27 GHUV01053303.1:290-763(+)
MADTVRYMMEEMVPELEDLVKQKYFSKQEVKQIVKRRQDFEYLLKRKAALKEDYLRCAGCANPPQAFQLHALLHKAANMTAVHFKHLCQWHGLQQRALVLLCRYIEYESKLEELRQHRKAALGEKGKHCCSAVPRCARLQLLISHLIGAQNNERSAK